MLRKILLVSAPLLILQATIGIAADDLRRTQRFSAELRPTQEVPALSSQARGRFKAVISEVDQTISFELSYRDLEAPPLFAHIHVGQRGVNGGVSVFLCGPPENAAEVCPEGSGKVTGLLTPANIVGPVAQGIDPATDAVNGFEELVRLLRSGNTYANVHSTKFPTGEIRGQIRPAQK